MFAPMTIHQIQQDLRHQLEQLYPSGEAQYMSEMLLEALTGWSRSVLAVHRQELLAPEKQVTLQKWLQELTTHRPIQYVIGSCWFYRHAFRVNESVLIPRAETEELVHWILQNVQDRNDAFVVTDVGTGSGCIAVSIAAANPNAVVYGIDKSSKALLLATENAHSAAAKVTFLELDFLDPSQDVRLPETDILVSNPPYIPIHQQKEMDAHVRDFEPWMALFVEDADPLIFYRRLAEVGQSKLKASGRLYVEIHESYGEQVVQLFREHGYHEVQLKKDMQGKDRMVRAQKN